MTLRSAATPTTCSTTQSSSSSSPVKRVLASSLLIEASGHSSPLGLLGGPRQMRLAQQLNHSAHPWARRSCGMFLCAITAPNTDRPGLVSAWDVSCASTAPKAERPGLVSAWEVVLRQHSSLDRAANTGLCIDTCPGLRASRSSSKVEDVVPAGQKAFRTMRPVIWRLGAKVGSEQSWSRLATSSQRELHLGGVSNHGIWSPEARDCASLQHSGFPLHDPGQEGVQRNTLEQRCGRIGAWGVHRLEYTVNLLDLLPGGDMVFPANTWCAK